MFSSIAGAKNRMFALVAGGITAMGLVVGIAGQSHAFVIDNTTVVGDSTVDFSVNFQLLPGFIDNGGNVYNGPAPLTAQIDYTIDLFSASSVTMTIDIANTSDPIVATNILGFGFFTNPEVTIGAFSGGSTFGSVAEDTNFPSFQEIDICVFSQNCTGGAFNSGLAPGSTDQVMLTLNGNFSGGSLAIEPHAIKFQGDFGSFEFGDGDCCMRVPEPAPMAVFSFGLLAFAWVRRRYNVRRVIGA